jgi:hypothetical protein
LPPPPLPERRAQSTEKGHGRLEQRTLRTTRILTVHEKWEGLQQGFELKRKRTIGGKTTEEVVYGITSLCQEEATAERLLRLTRDHWKIENQVHYVRDVTLGEDSRLAPGSPTALLSELFLRSISGDRAGAEELERALLDRTR